MEVLTKEEKKKRIKADLIENSKQKELAQSKIAELRRTVKYLTAKREELKKLYREIV